LHRNFCNATLRRPLLRLSRHRRARCWSRAATSLGSQINQAVREKDEQKADALTRKINDLEKTLGPEYLAFFDALNNLDQNPKEFRDILPVFDTLNQSCPH
jgi:hypothetical protein